MSVPVQKLATCDQLSHQVHLAWGDVHGIQVDAIGMLHLHASSEVSAADARKYRSRSSDEQTSEYVQLAVVARDMDAVLSENKLYLA